MKLEEKHEMPAVFSGETQKPGAKRLDKCTRCMKTRRRDIGAAPKGCFVFCEEELGRCITGPLYMAHMFLKFWMRVTLEGVKGNQSLELRVFFWCVYFVE